LIVLHALWDSASSTLRLFAESSHIYNTTPTRKTKRAGAATAPLHPFVLSSEELKTILSDEMADSISRQLQAGIIALKLPSGSNAPLPSPSLLVERTQLTEKPTLAVWMIPTLSLSTQPAFDILYALPADSELQGIDIGESLHFWATAANLAYECVVRQNYLPTLHTMPNGQHPTYRAAWQAYFSPQDRQRMASLAHMMPPLCWSLLPTPDQTTERREALLLDFLNHCTDAIVRTIARQSNILTAKRGRAAEPPARQWLRALISDTPILTGSSEELAQFAQDLHGWLAQLQTTTAETAFRTCFRLEAPGEGTDPDAPWQISFLLQATDDPSLLVAAEQVWRERSSTLTFLKRTFENPQERLLADLARAARIFPPIEESLHNARPSNIQVDSERAYRFLRETAPLLEQSGYGVLVPPWWQKGSARVRMRLKLKPKVGAQSSGLLGMNSIVAYDWQVAVGDTAMSVSEFERLVMLKQPLVQVRGQWVELRPQEIETAIAFFKKHRSGQMTLGEALRADLGQDTDNLALPVESVEAEGWINDVLTGLKESKISLIQQPTGLHGQLRPYQLKGTSWMAFLKQYGLGACLADDMGLGKTIQLISLLLHERANNDSTHHIGPTLIICPMSIVGNWQREIQRFAPSLSILIHHGADRMEGERLLTEACNYDVVITTYNIALRDKEHLTQVTWENVVLDEAQNIKNETARQTQAIKQLRANYRIALTGTPVENRLGELWSIMEFLNPGYLGSGEAFRKNFTIPIERYHEQERAETLRRIIQPFVLRRQKTDKEIISDLPDKMEMKVYCNLTREQATLYEAVVKEMMEKIEEAEGMERRGLILSTLTKLKQVCNHPAQFMGDGSALAKRSGKLERLEEMLDEVQAEGDKALIFTQYAEMGTMLRQYLQEQSGYETLFLHGGTPKKQRDLMVQRFQEDKRGARFFILSLKAGGVGLNLTAANHVFHFDRWWNPAVENQATDRAFRIGQQRNVQVHKFVCIGTLEERIDVMIEQKKELAESIIGTGENWLTEMSTTQLKELFALSREAIGE